MILGVTKYFGREEGGLGPVDNEVLAVQEPLVIGPNRPFTLLASLDRSSLVLIDLVDLHQDGEVHLLLRACHDPAIFRLLTAGLPCEVPAFYENGYVVLKHSPVLPALLRLRVTHRPVVVPPVILELESSRLAC